MLNDRRAIPDAAQDVDYDESERTGPRDALRQPDAFAPRGDVRICRDRGV